MIHPKKLLAALAGSLLVLAGCSYDATEVPAPPEPPPAEGGDAAAECNSEEAVRSYAPGGVTAGAAVDQLKNDDRLVVGVSADSYLLGARDPLSERGEIVGFDIDFARRIAKELGVRLERRVMTAADRISALESGDVDIVARNMTINCERWEEIAFSAEYYHAGQKVLLRKDLAQKYRGPEDLQDLRVCAPSGTSSIDQIREVQPHADVVAARTHTGCLVELQQGRVDAITGDDTVLAGLAAQDPYAKVPPNQEAFSEEPYGIGVNAKDTDLVRFINGVLEEMRSDGSWQDSYDKWLAPTLGKGSPPAPKYGR